MTNSLLQEWVVQTNEKGYTGKETQGKAERWIWRESWKTFHITGKVICPEQWNCTDPKLPPATVPDAKNASCFHNQKFQV